MTSGAENRFVQTILRRRKNTDKKINVELVSPEALLVGCIVMVNRMNDCEITEKERKIVWNEPLSF